MVCNELPFQRIFLAYLSLSNLTIDLLLLFLILHHHQQSSINSNQTPASTGGFEPSISNTPPPRPPGTGAQNKICASLLPERNFPASIGLKSKAKPCRFGAVEKSVATGRSRLVNNRVFVGLERQPQEDGIELNFLDVFNYVESYVYI